MKWKSWSRLKVNMLCALPASSLQTQAGSMLFNIDDRYQRWHHVDFLSALSAIHYTDDSWSLIFLQSSGTQSAKKKKSDDRCE